ncbi:hypothetical protein RM812_39060, partial [Streptomyces sp. DSM 40712]|nr:hypothetical protein [Streptomyces sp. DSM 40712]
GVAASTAGPIPEDPTRGVRSASLWVRSDGAQLAELVAKVDAGELRLHVAAHRRPAAAPLPRADLDQAKHAAASLLAAPEPSIAAFQTRAGLAALELDTNGPHTHSLVPALTEVARLDAYAACDVLGHPAARAILDTERASSLGSAVAHAGLGADALPADHQRSLSESVAHGEAELRRLLRDDKAAPGNPPKEVPQPT